jgi:hypothetical protein
MQLDTYSEHGGGGWREGRARDYSGFLLSGKRMRLEHLVSPPAFILEVIEQRWLDLKLE